MSYLFLQGNAKSVLEGLPADYFHCCVTSPPYFNLRKYEGGDTEIWGGDDSCQHEWSAEIIRRDRGVAKGASAVVGNQLREVSGVETKQGSACTKCGAWRGQLGSEMSPESYIQHLIEIMREVRRVLRPDGCFFLNIGDSWATHASGGKGYVHNFHAPEVCVENGIDAPKPTAKSMGMKELDMVLIPEQLALAARADGWYVRSILIWAKGVSLSDEFDGNPMPESVNGWRWERHKVKVGDNGRGREAWRVGANSTPQQDYNKDGNFKNSAVWQDCPGCSKCEKHNGYVLRKGSWRPTDSFEYVLMLTKTGSYFCDREAVLEPIAPSTIGRGKVSFGGEKGRNYNPDESDPNFRNGSEQWGREYDYTKSNGNGGRNLRSVLMIPTVGYKGAHFACVDSDTECLTTRGWKHYTDLCNGELVASYNLSSGRLRWSPLLSVSQYDVDGTEMVYSNHRSLDMALTLDHRCLVRWGTGVRIKSASKLNPYDQIVTSAEWEDIGGLTPVSPAMAALIGWYLTEGHEPKRRGYSVEISQSLTANAGKVEDIRSTLADVEAEFEEATFEREYRGRLVSQTNFRIHGFVAAKLREMCPRRQFPVGILLWDTPLLRKMFDAIIAGDGNIRSDNRKFFTQKDKGRLDVFQAIAVRLGYGAGIFPRVGPCSAVSIYENKTSRALRDSEGHSLLRHANYTGVVWCPQTPDTTFVARRNGKVFITGNTFPPRLVEPLLKAATSEKGCCPKCGSPWARVIDKGFTAHDGDTDTAYSEGTNANRLALLRQGARQRGAEYGRLSYNSKYKEGGVIGLATRGYQRNETIEGERSQSRVDAERLFPDDLRAQQNYVNHIHDHGGLDKGSTIGWLPTCECQIQEAEPCRILDPFSGAGTTALVAERLGLDSIGIDTSAEYIKLAEDRIIEDEQKRIDEQIKQFKKEARQESKGAR